MRNTIIFTLSVAALVLAAPASAFAQTYYYQVPVYQQPTYAYQASTYGTTMNERELADYLRRLIADLQNQLNARRVTYTYYNTPTYTQYSQNHYTYDYQSGNYVVGKPRSGTSYYDHDYKDDRYYDDEPEAYTSSATSVGRYEARLRGEVRMNDFSRGEVFFVYGTDRALIDDVDDAADSYADVSTRSDRLEKIRVNSNASGSRSYEAWVSGLIRDREYYFRACVGYKDSRNRDALTCGTTLRFTTDR